MSGELIDLRRRAEERLSARRDAASGTAGLTAEVLAQELEVHRIELDMQRDEIERQRDDAQASRDRYATLCDHAPVGLLVVDTFGRILDANVTAWRQLGLERRYEPSTDLMLYLDWPSTTKLRAALSRGVAVVIDVRMRPRRAQPFHALLSLAPSSRSDTTFQLAIVDTSSRVAPEPSLALVPEPGADEVSLLLVEPYVPGRRALRDALDELGYHTIDAEDGEDALRLPPAVSPALVIADYDPGQPKSRALLDALCSRWPDVPALLLCRTRPAAASLPAKSVVLPKPISLRELEHAIASLLGPRAHR